MRLTIEQLKTIAEYRKKEDERVKLAVSLDICPVCGGDIIEENTEVLGPPLKFWIFIHHNIKTWSSRKICSRDKSHYEHKEDYSSYDNFYF